MSEAFTMESLNKSKWFSCSLSHQQKWSSYGDFEARTKCPMFLWDIFRRIQLFAIHKLEDYWLSLHCLLLLCLLTLCWMGPLFTPIFFAIHFEDSVPGTKVKGYTSNFKRVSGHDYSLFILLKTISKSCKSHIQNSSGVSLLFIAVMQCQKNYICIWLIEG